MYKAKKSKKILICHSLTPQKANGAARPVKTPTKLCQQNTDVCVGQYAILSTREALVVPTLVAKRVKDLGTVRIHVHFCVTLVLVHLARLLLASKINSYKIINKYLE